MHTGIILADFPSTTQVTVRTMPRRERTRRTSPKRALERLPKITQRKKKIARLLFKARQLRNDYDIVIIIRN
jgi:hypothetical protein